MFMSSVYTCEARFAVANRTLMKFLFSPVAMIELFIVSRFVVN